MKYVVPKELLPLLRSKVTRKEVEEMIGSGRYLPIASASTLGAIRVGNSLTIDSDGVLSVVGSGISVEWGNISDTPTTLSGYGITDAGISGNTITLGNTSITPLVSFTETDPTVPSWAKQANKPSYAYSEISGTPTNVSTFINDAGYLTEHQSLDALTPKVQAIPYIVGPNTDETAGTWTGTYEGITALTEGLTIVYVPHVAGATTTTLNINGLGAKTCYYSGTSKLTTHYPVGTPILFTYYNNGWRRADYNSNTTYSAGTKALFDAGTNTSNRVWSASVLASAVAPIEHEHDWTDINNAPAFITADALNGYATETYVDTEISDLNLGTASQKDYTTFVTQGGTDLPTSDAVYSAISSAVTSALHYRGMSSTAITDGGTETATIGGQPLTAQSGDIVIYNGLEFLWEEGHWNKLGDDSSYALKTVTVTGTDGITGGGDLTANRTLGLSSTTQTNINKGVTAYGWGDHSQAGYLTSFTETDPTVPSWAKASTKPSYDYDEIENTPFIPTNVSDLTNDAGYISTETDPVFSASAAHGITSSNISSWNSKYSKPSGGIPKTDLASSIQTTLSNADTAYSWGDHAQAGYLTSFTETDPVFSASPSHGITVNNITNWNTAFSWGNHANAGYLTSVPIATGSVAGGFIYGDPIDTLIVLNNGYLAVDLLGLNSLIESKGYITGYTETDPVFTASASHGITSSDITSWNGKYSKPSGGIPKTDLASAVQASLDKADTALQSFTETDPTVPNWAKQASKPTYTASEVGALPDTTVIPTKTSDLTNDSGFITGYTETDPIFSASAAAGITSSDVSAWNGKQDAISDLSTIRTNASHGNTAYGWGDHSQAGYLTSYTETDPVFGASAAAGITSGNISTWNAKYSKPSGGIPKSDLASAVQTSLGLADTALQSYTETDPVFSASDAAGITAIDVSNWDEAYGWGNHAEAGYIKSVPLAADSTIGGFKTGNVNQTYLYLDNGVLKVSDSAIADYLSGEGYFDLPTWGDIQNTPDTIAGYGITDAKIANGTITLGSNSITPLTSFTETDPTVPSWAKASSKPTYTLDEVADGSTRKLSNYLPLTGGTITGDLTVDQHISANSISLNEFFVGDLINEVADDLGSSGYPWGGVYANNFYGSLDWSYVQNKPTIPTKTSDLTNDSLVSSVKINGDNYTPSSGAVDLGFQGYGELIMGTHTATTASWTGVSKLPSASAFVSGYRFTYFAPYTGTSDGDTLTLTFQDNSTITVDLYYKATTRLSTHFGAGAKIDFIYLVNANIGGTTRTGCWPHSTYYSDTTNARGLQSYYERGRLYSASAPLYRYKICGYRDGKIVPTTITNQSSATQVNKVPTSIAMDPSRGLVYYSTTTAITTANAALAAQTLHESYNMQTCMYNFNETVPAYCDVYFRGIYDYSTGLFSLDTSQTNSNYRSYYAFAPKASGDYYSDFETGYFYWFVGCAYSTADYIQMKSEHPLYYFNSTQLIHVDLNIIQMISSAIPENVSDLNNDAGYVTDGYVDTEIVDYAQKKITISSSEPTSSQGQNGDIWLVI